MVVHQLLHYAVGYTNLKNSAVNLGKQQSLPQRPFQCLLNFCFMKQTLKLLNLDGKVIKQWCNYSCAHCTHFIALFSIFSPLISGILLLYFEG